jgi:hypothetical protein
VATVDNALKLKLEQGSSFHAKPRLRRHVERLVRVDRFEQPQSHVLAHV